MALFLIIFLINLIKQISVKKIVNDDSNLINLSKENNNYSNIIDINKEEIKKNILLNKYTNNTLIRTYLNNIRILEEEKFDYVKELIPILLLISNETYRSLFEPFGKICENYTNSSIVINTTVDILTGNETSRALIHLIEALTHNETYRNIIKKVTNYLKKVSKKRDMVIYFLNVLYYKPQIFIYFIGNLSSGNETQIENRNNLLKEIVNNAGDLDTLKRLIPKFLQNNKELSEHLIDFFLTAISVNKEGDEYLNIIFDYVSYQLLLFSDTRFFKTYNISLGCFNLLNFTLRGIYKNNNITNIELRNYYLYKFILDTPKNKNDFFSYDKCLGELPIFNNITVPDKQDNEINVKIKANLSYIITNIGYADKDFDNLKNNTRFENYYYYMGLCLPQGVKSEENYDSDTDTYYYCEEEDYNKIMKMLLFVITNVDDVTCESFNMYKDIEIKYAELIPLFILIIPLIIFIFLFIYKNIAVMFQSKKKRSIIDRPLKSEIANDNDNDDEHIDERDILNEKFTNEENSTSKTRPMPKWFILLNQFFNLKNNYDELFDFNSQNIKGMNYILGLMGISIILTILGFTFLTLVNLPVKEFGLYHFYKIIYNFFYFFTFIGLRYSPRVIFSCSGYILIYKYLSFIERGENNYFLKFFLPQIYKYLYFLLTILFCRYSLYYFQFIADYGPTWEIFNRRILKNPADLFDFFLELSTIKSFYIKKYENREIGSLLDYFWLPINEFIFFIIGTILISIGYKFKIRIDYILILSIILLYIGKIIFYFIFDNYVEKIYTTLYYYLFDYGKLMINPLFNISYFLIGMYFGLMNYTIQKGINDIGNEIIFNKYNSNIYNKDEDEILKKERKSVNINKFLNSKDIYSIGNDDDFEDEEDDSNNDDSKSSLNKKRTSSSVGAIEDNKSDEKKSKDKNKKQFSKIDKNTLSKTTKKNNLKYNIKELKEMPFLISAMNFVNMHKNPKYFKIFIIILIILSLTIVLFISAPYIFFVDYINKEPKDKVEIEEKYTLEYLITNKAINIFYLIDIEIVVFYVQWLFFVLFMKGHYFINDFLGHLYWSFLNKTYFSFLIILSPIILYFLYESDTIIKLNRLNLYLYFFMTLVIILIFLVLVYIIYELPLKKIFKYIFRANNKINVDEDYIKPDYDDKEDENE